MRSSLSMRRKALEAVTLVALAAALALSASAAAAAPTLSVFFLRGEQLASVQRHGSGATDAVRSLFAVRRGQR